METSVNPATITVILTVDEANEVLAAFRNAYPATYLDPNTYLGPLSLRLGVFVRDHGSADQ